MIEQHDKNDEQDQLRRVDGTRNIAVVKDDDDRQSSKKTNIEKKQQLTTIISQVSNQEQAELAVRGLFVVESKTDEAVNNDGNIMTIINHQEEKEKKQDHQKRKLKKVGPLPHLSTTFYYEIENTGIPIIPKPPATKTRRTTTSITSSTNDDGRRSRSEEIKERRFARHHHYGNFCRRNMSMCSSHLLDHSFIEDATKKENTRRDSYLVQQQKLSSSSVSCGNTNDEDDSHSSFGIVSSLSILISSRESCSGSREPPALVSSALLNENENIKLSTRKNVDEVMQNVQRGKKEHEQRKEQEQEVHQINDFDDNNFFDGNNAATKEEQEQWVEYWDEEVGANYYYNILTGEATWVAPSTYESYSTSPTM